MELSLAILARCDIETQCQFVLANDSPSASQARPGQRQHLSRHDSSGLYFGLKSCPLLAFRLRRPACLMSGPCPG